MNGADGLPISDSLGACAGVTQGNTAAGASRVLVSTNGPGGPGDTVCDFNDAGVPTCPVDEPLDPEIALENQNNHVVEQ